MRLRVGQRLNEITPTHYPASEIDAAINEAQRLFCLLTLALETTASWTPAVTFTHMLTVFSDWIAPLRIATAAGAKIRPVKLIDLAALDPAWPSASGAIERYNFSGVDLVAVYPTAGTALSVTYARSPLPLVGDSDEPEIPAQYDPVLIKYAIYRCRQGEGAQELEKVLPYYKAFLDAAEQYAGFVVQRQMDRGLRYDTLPFELAKFRELEGTKND